MLNRLLLWARRLKLDVVALWIAARDMRTPLHAMLVAWMVAGYALSPIDLIPDFIPILGQLDDLIIVPLGIALAIRLIPPPMLEEYRRDALFQASKPRSKWAAAAIVIIWAACAVGLWMLISRA